MKINATTNGAVRILMACDRDRPVTTAEMARRLNMAEPTIAKTCGSLMRAGLLTGRRGRHGGYLLARAPERIRILDVLDLFEPEAEVFPCRPAAESPCRLAVDCGLRLACAAACRAFRDSLAGLTLDRLGRAPGPAATVA